MAYRSPEEIDDALRRMARRDALKTLGLAVVFVVAFVLAFWLLHGF